MALNIVILLGILLAETTTSDTFSAFVKYISTAVFAKILIDECFKDAQFFYKVVQYLKYVCVFSLLFLGAQLIWGSAFSFEKTANINVVNTVVGSAQDRLPSFFLDPQNYAQFLAIVSFLFLIKHPTHEGQGFLNYAILFLVLIALMITGGRAAFGGWVIGIAILLIVGKPELRAALLLPLSLLALVLYNYGDHFAMLNRDTTIDDAYDFRNSIWKDAFKISMDHPFVGIGIGDYAKYVSIHNPDQFFNTETEIVYYDFPESGYLKLLTEFGFIGFAAIFSFIAIPIYKGITLFFKNKDMHLLLLIASIFCWLIGFYTVYSIGDIRMRILMVTIICLLFDRAKWGALYV
jgi:O-antigen ligase